MAGGDGAFVEFVRESSARLVHAAYLLTSDRHYAEDVAQTAFAKAYAAWSRVRRQDAYAYTRRIMVNEVIDRWRRPIREHPVDELAERGSQECTDAAVVRREWVTGMLDGLTVRERAVVVLRHYFDLPEATVAGELGISLGAVKSTNSRALAKLRVVAEQTGGDQGDQSAPTHGAHR